MAGGGGGRRRGGEREDRRVLRLRMMLMLSVLLLSLLLLLLVVVVVAALETCIGHLVFCVVVAGRLLVSDAMVEFAGAGGGLLSRHQSVEIR